MKAVFTGSLLLAATFLVQRQTPVRDPEQLALRHAIGLIGPSKRVLVGPQLLQPVHVDPKVAVTSAREALPTAWTDSIALGRRVSTASLTELLSCSGTARARRCRMPEDVVQIELGRARIGGDTATVPMRIRRASDVNAGGFSSAWYLVKLRRSVTGWTVVRMRSQSIS